MEINLALDLPPVPDCFSKLLLGDDNTESSASANQPWREAERLREIKDAMLKSMAEKSIPDTRNVGDGDYERSCQSVVCESKPGHRDRPTQNQAVEFSNICFNGDQTTHILTEDGGAKASKEMDSTFSRLNAAVKKLKREMIDLRHMDMSLFCQLLTLNEAIHDFKMSVSERSEYTGSEYTGSEFTGSEYSFGGMGSRSGSLTSLIEESEWSRAVVGATHDELLSPSSGGDPGVPEDFSMSASDLLQQIKALTQRAETDFSF